MTGEVSFKYLKDQIETSRLITNVDFMMSQAKPTSVYEAKFGLLDKEVQNILKQMSEDRDISYSPTVAFEKLFQN